MNSSKTVFVVTLNGVPQSAYQTLDVAMSQAAISEEYFPYSGSWIITEVIMEVNE